MLNGRASKWRARLTWPSESNLRMWLRNPLPAQAHLGIIVDLKSHFPAQIAQHLNVARRLVPEVEVVAFVDFPGMQALLQDFMGKLVRRHQRKIARKREQQDRVDPGGFQQAQFFRKRSQQFQVVTGTQDAGGMGLEGDNHRLRAPSFRAPHDFVHNVAVSAVHTVEVTDADERGTEVAGNIVEFVESSHPKSFYRRDVSSRWSLVASRWRACCEPARDFSLTTND